jgi:hypothetical protein
MIEPRIEKANTQVNGYRYGSDRLALNKIAGERSARLCVLSIAFHPHALSFVSFSMSFP